MPASIVASQRTVQINVDSLDHGLRPRQPFGWKRHDPSRIFDHIAGKKIQKRLQRFVPSNGLLGMDYPEDNKSAARILELHAANSATEAHHLPERSWNGKLILGGQLCFCFENGGHVYKLMQIHYLTSPFDTIFQSVDYRLEGWLSRLQSADCAVKGKI